jgi:hypothetical protein
VVLWAFYRRLHAKLLTWAHTGKGMTIIWSEKILIHGWAGWNGDDAQTRSRGGDKHAA